VWGLLQGAGGRGAVGVGWSRRRHLLWQEGRVSGMLLQLHEVYMFDCMRYTCSAGWATWAVCFTTSPTMHKCDPSFLAGHSSESLAETLEPLRSRRLPPPPSVWA
jgi:hypothetical protein